MQRLRPMICLVALCVAAHVRADPPEILAVRADTEGAGWRFDVTLRHPDTGWDHFADGWEVLAPDGTRLGFRELFHPHVHEQPFTRSLRSVTIPDDVTQVLIRARCNLDGWGAGFVTVDLPD
jgi:hypothetical protein